ncbi:hypothetical protein HDV05_008409 [Chytridiales sp. JEL 0842]|nr:hypothetical protein HDV05_008409 [Chytridiales sp. JEL 0842]
MFLFRKDDNNYEKILSALEEKIAKAELKLSDIKIRERNVALSWMYYSIPTYLLFLIEELKKKTGYYTTKGLIDRFDSPVKDKQSPMKHNPNMAGTPMQQQGLRQRSASALTPQPHGRLPPGQSMLGTPYSNGFQIPQHPVHGTPIMRPPGVASPMPPSIPPSPAPANRMWYERVVEAIVGDAEGPHQKYALICQQCFEHNGLVLPEEYASSRFRCLKCGYLNAKSGRRLDSEFSPPPSPSPQLMGFPEGPQSSTSTAPPQEDIGSSESLASQTETVKQVEEECEASAEDVGAGEKEEEEKEQVGNDAGDIKEQ